MSTLPLFLERCEALCKRTQISRATLSTRLLGSGTRLEQLASGRDIGVRRLEKAFEQLARMEREAGAEITIVSPAPVLTLPDRRRESPLAQLLFGGVRSG